VELTKKDKKFKWSPDCEKAFLKLKESLISPPILTMFNSDLLVHIYADSSYYMAGAVIRQQHPDENEAVEYASSSLRGHQRRWTISEKESFAILFALKKWRIYINGSTDQLIFKDHNKTNQTKK
jgi:hypothetical protein